MSASINERIPFAAFVFVGVLTTLGASPAVASEAWREEALARMTVEEKVGQLLVPAVHPDRLGPETGEAARLRRLVCTGRVGGLHFFRSDAHGARSVANHFQREGRVPLLVTADLEGGAGYIFRGGTRFPRPLALAATGDPALVEAVGRWTARQGRAVGVHVNFAPVLDVNINPDNPIINLRSFGEEPEAVARWGAAYLAGVQGGGMIATAKHFPGHGDTETDSHLELPVVLADRARLDRVELPPFVRAVREGVGAVMTAHIAWPRIVRGDGDPLPATLEPRIVRAILREEMGFDGLVFTDALNMRGITSRFPVGEAALRAIQAGADLLLFAEVERVFPALLAAVTSGELTEERLDESVRRILDAKARAGLHRDRFFEPGVLHEALGSSEVRALARTAAERSLVLLRKEAGRFPLAPVRGRRVLVVVTADPGQSWWQFDPGVELAAELTRRGARVRTAVLDGGATDLDGILAAADEVDDVVVAAYMGLAAFRGVTGLTRAQGQAIDRLGRRGALLVALGNPYGIPGTDGFRTVLLGFDTGGAMDRAAARALAGEFFPEGTLPVGIPGVAERGAGLSSRGPRGSSRTRR